MKLLGVGSSCVAPIDPEGFEFCVCSRRVSLWPRCCRSSSVITGFQTGSGKRFHTKQHTHTQIPYVWPYVAFNAHVLPQTPHMLPHFATFCHESLFIIGNRGPSVVSPFVLTPSGSCQGEAPRPPTEVFEALRQPGGEAPAELIV